MVPNTFTDQQIMNVFPKQLTFQVFEGSQSTLELMLRGIFLEKKKIDEMEIGDSAFKYTHANMDLLG